MELTASTRPSPRRFSRAAWILPITAAALLTGCGEFDDPTVDETFDPATAPPPPTREAVAPSPTRNLLWGDLHIHTALSYDAFTMGVRGTPDDAYTYMKGGTIEHAIGYPIRASRPLDFGGVTDHAEYLGVPRHLANGGAEESKSLRDSVRSGSPLRVTWNFARVTYSQMASR